MRLILGGACAILLVCWGAAGSAQAPAVEHVIYVESALRVVTQCELRAFGPRELTCDRDGWPVKVALGRGITVWKGQDRKEVTALRLGDRLDIKLGLDAKGNEVATFIWANLVKIEGVVGRAGAYPWFRVHPLVPYSIGDVSAEPLFALLGPDTTFAGKAGAADLRQGSPVIIIGERLDDRRLRANRILLARQ